MYHVVFKVVENVNQKLPVYSLHLGRWVIPRFSTVISFCQTQTFFCPKSGQTPLFFFQYIDTATLQMDLVESPLFTPPIILLQTVIEEVRHRSLPLYNRLKALTRMDDKKIWIFYNEYRSWVVHHSSLIELYSEKKELKRNCYREGGGRDTKWSQWSRYVSEISLNVTGLPPTFLGIRKAAAWYKSHLNLNRPPVRGQGPPKVPTIVLMTEDAANRQKAEKSGITSTSGEFPALAEFFFSSRELNHGLYSTQVRRGYERLYTTLRSSCCCR